MNYHKYTLDRFDGDFAVFLKHPDEMEELLIRRTNILVALKEGDIVRIQEVAGNYQMDVLQDETNAQKQSIQQLMNKLRQQDK